MRHYGTIELKTVRLLLRPFRETDAEAMFENWASDPEVTKYLTWKPHKSVDDTRLLLRLWEEEAEDPTNYHWAIECGGELLGDIALVWQHGAVGTVGYCLARRAWGKGIMTEALGAVLKYLFEKVGFHRIQSCHSVENPASGRVMEKCGFRYEGTHREEFCLLSTGKWTDIAHRAILEQDYFRK